MHTDWPSYLHSKGVFFVKRDVGSLPSATSQQLLDHLTCGDVHPNILGQITTLNDKDNDKYKDIGQIISAPGWRKSSCRSLKIGRTDRSSLIVYLRVNIQIFSSYLESSQSDLVNILSDIKKQVDSLAGIVNQIRGLVQGKTRLSFPGVRGLVI